MQLNSLNALRKQDIYYPTAGVHLNAASISVYSPFHLSNAMQSSGSINWGLVRFPCTSASSIHCRICLTSSEESLSSAPFAFSSMRSIFRLPGIGKTGCNDDNQMRTIYVEEWTYTNNLDMMQESTLVRPDTQSRYACSLAPGTCQQAQHSSGSSLLRSAARAGANPLPQSRRESEIYWGV